MNELELFLEWHFNGWKSNNANADSIEFAKKLYDRVYSHDHTSCVRELEFKAWQASANREGYKLVPFEPTQEMIDNAVDKTSETPSQDYWHSSQPISDDQAVECYRAMIGACDDS